MNKNYQKGMSEFFLVVLLAAAVVIVVVFLMFFRDGSNSLKNLGGARPTPSPTAEQVMEMGKEPVSDSDEASVLQDELDKTVVGDLEGDFKLLDSDASAL